MPHRRGAAVLSDPPRGPDGRVLRVLQATPGYAPAYGLGGPTQSLEGLDDHLARLGVDVRVLTTDSAGRERLRVVQGWTTWQGIPVRYVRRWLPPDVAPSYLPIAMLHARRSHIVHVTGVFSVTSMQAMAATLAAGRPSVLSTRGALEPSALTFGAARRKQRWLAAFGPLMRRATLFHATSAEEATSIRDVLGAGAAVRIVPNGVDPEEAIGPREPPALPTLGFIGRIHRVKAVERLVEAAALLRDRGLRFRLEIAGPTPDARYRQEIETHVARLGLGEIATLRGELRGDAKRSFYEGCNVVALPSFTENFGNVVVEALSHGVPVVASRHTPWAELEAYECGRWVDNTPSDLADALEPYLRSSALAREQGLRGRRLVEQHYTWSAVALSMLNVYREAIARHRDGSTC